MNTSPHLALALTATTILAGCMNMGIETTALPAQLTYVCAQNRTLQVTRSADQRAAGVMLNGTQIVLPRASSAAQEKYSDGRYSLYLEGEKAMLEDSGRVIYDRCQTPVELPTYIRQPGQR